MVRQEWRVVHGYVSPVCTAAGRIQKAGEFRRSDVPSHYDQEYQGKDMKNEAAFVQPHFYVEKGMIRGSTT